MASGKCPSSFCNRQPKESSHLSFYDDRKYLQALVALGFFPATRHKNHLMVRKGAERCGWLRIFPVLVRAEHPFYSGLVRIGQTRLRRASAAAWLLRDNIHKTYVLEINWLFLYTCCRVAWTRRGKTGWVGKYS